MLYIVWIPFYFRHTSIFTRTPFSKHDGLKTTTMSINILLHASLWWACLPASWLTIHIFFVLEDLLKCMGSYSFNLVASRPANESLSSNCYSIYMPKCGCNIGHQWIYRNCNSIDCKFSMYKMSLCIGIPNLILNLLMCKLCICHLNRCDICYMGSCVKHLTWWRH